MSHPDANLCARLAAELPGTFPELVADFQQQLFAFALRLTGGHQSDAEDILQEAVHHATVEHGLASLLLLLSLGTGTWGWQRWQRAHT